MVLFWCRTKQAQLRALSVQLKRCYFQIHGSSSAIQETKIGAVNRQSLTFLRTRPELGNYVRFFAAPVQVKPKYEEKDKGRPRMNEEISAAYVRLVTDEGHAVVSRREALERARVLNVDLVEVQADGDPPVCKLMDYKKEMYLRHVKEKERTKKKSDVVLRKGGLKEVRINHKIDKHDMQTKADTVRRLAERGYRVKCMAVAVGAEKQEEQQKQELGGLLSRLSALIDDFSLVESGPIVEPKQAYVVVRHVKFGPLKKGPGKKKLLAISNANTSAQSLETNQSLDESDSETETETETEEAIKFESYSPDDFDISRNKTHESTVKFAPETSNRDRSGPENRYAATRQANASANGSENRYATMRTTNGSGPGVRRTFDPESQSQSRSQSYGMFGAPKTNNDPQRESGPAEVNRYKKGPKPQVPPSDHRGGRGDYSRENTNTNTNPSFIREKQAGFRR